MLGIIFGMIKKRGIKMEIKQENIIMALVLITIGMFILFIVNNLYIISLHDKTIDNINKRNAETFIKAAGLNISEVLQSYEYCALMMNSSDLVEISKACSSCVQDCDKQ